MCRDPDGTHNISLVTYQLLLFCHFKPISDSHNLRQEVCTLLQGLRVDAVRYDTEDFSSDMCNVAWGNPYALLANWLSRCPMVLASLPLCGLYCNLVFP